MSYSIFNIKNHKLNAESSRQILSFATDDFCGIIRPNKTDSVADGVIQSGKSWTWSKSAIATENLFLVGGGCLIQGDFTDKYAIDGTMKLWYIDVKLTDDTANLLTDVTTQVQVKSVKCNSFTQSQDKASVSISLSSAIGNINSFTYRGFTIWVGQDEFIIPICFNTSNNTLVSLIQVRSKSAFEEYLSVQALNQLWEDLHATFTHKAGSSNEHPDYGKLGDFNIKGSNVEHKGAIIVYVDDNNKLHIHPYDNGSLFINNSEVKSGTLPIHYGGTGAINKKDAKTNLGIYYSETNEGPDEHHFTTTPSVGDIYFRILEG